MQRREVGYEADAAKTSHRKHRPSCLERLAVRGPACGRAGTARTIDAAVLRTEQGAATERTRLHLPITRGFSAASI